MYTVLLLQSQRLLITDRLTPFHTNTIPSSTVRIPDDHPRETGLPWPLVR